MIQAGITTFAEHYFFCDEIATAVQESGTREDIAMLKDHDVAIAQCPKTYMKLAMGSAPVDAFRAAGIKVGWARMERLKRLNQRLGDQCMATYPA